MNHIKKYYKLSRMTKWLVISCIFFAFTDALTTALCLTNVPTTVGYELSPIWSAYYKYLGPWFGSIPLLVAKYLVLVLACYGALRAVDERRKICEWAFVLVYLITHLVCVINNTYALVLMLIHL